MHEYRARVKRIVDGDTVDFEVDLGFYVKVHVRGRLQGVDTPERGEEDFDKASDACLELLRSVGQLEYNASNTDLYVTIKTEKTGKFGRWIVEIPGVTDKLAERWPYKGSQ